MKPQPFCCDITSGTPEEQQEFKMLFVKASKQNDNSMNRYSGYNLIGKFDWYFYRDDALTYFTRILPLSEGIAILKQMVGEEEKPTYTEQEIDFAYLAGVFNASGIDGLYNEIQRLKSLGKNPHDIIIEGRNQPKP